jgi:outer membrane protein assembly factor BamB
MLSGGQYESVFFSPGPPLPGGGQAPNFSVTLRGSPAYRTSFGAFTDGNFIYPVYADNFGNIFVIRFAWRVVLDGSGNVQSVTPLYLQRRVYRGLPAALGTVSSDRAGSILLLGFHDGLVLALSTSIPLALPIEWLTTFQTLSGGVSDSVDRPIAVTSDESTAIVCGSNSGRVYGVAMADGSRQWEYQAGGAIMGGPSIGPDPNYGNEDTVYIVVRHSPTQSAIHAIRASNGRGKWVRVLPNVSRCTPTIDQNGVLYIGDERGFLYAINPNNSVKWQLYLGAPIRVAPVIGEFDFRDNPTTFMFVAASNRFLYAIVDQSVLSTGISPGTGVGGLGTVPLPGGAR